MMSRVPRRQWRRKRLRSEGRGVDDLVKRPTWKASKTESKERHVSRCPLSCVKESRIARRSRPKRPRGLAWIKYTYVVLNASWQDGLVWNMREPRSCQRGLWCCRRRSRNLDNGLPRCADEVSASSRDTWVRRIDHEQGSSEGDKQQHIRRYVDCSDVPTDRNTGHVQIIIVINIE